MKSTLVTAIFATAFAMSPASAAAQNGTSECELHIFPTLEGQAMTTGWLSGFGAIGAIADAAANKDRNINEAEYLKEALGPQMQVNAFKSINVAETLGLPMMTVIYETPIADRKITTKAANRLSNSTAPCYVELIVTQNFYRKAAIYGRSLNNRFIFKDFRDGKKARQSWLKDAAAMACRFFHPKQPMKRKPLKKNCRTFLSVTLSSFRKPSTTVQNRPTMFEWGVPVAPHKMLELPYYTGT